MKLPDALKPSGRASVSWHDGERYICYVVVLLPGGYVALFIYQGNHFYGWYNTYETLSRLETLFANDAKLYYASKTDIEHSWKPILAPE
jgi:hypothetical protein